MAFLTLTPNGGGSATTIPVLVASPPEQQAHDVGSLRRAFSGPPHDSRRARPREWSGVQTIASAAAGAALKTLLEGTQPLTASGDLTGSSVPVFCTSPKTTPVRPGYVRVSFDMWADE